MRSRLIVAWTFVVCGLVLALVASIAVTFPPFDRFAVGATGGLLALYGLIGYDIDGGGGER